MQNLDDAFFREALFPAGTKFPAGGQELIAVEIVSALRAHACKKLWLPYSLGPLAEFARGHGILVCENPGKNFNVSIHIDSLYLGTPTIVANRKLFRESAPGTWNKRVERTIVRSFCREAAEFGARLIITGLGSGDVTVHNRCADMKLPGWKDPRVICMKDFGIFTDWVLLTERR